METDTLRQFAAGAAVALLSGLVLHVSPLAAIGLSALAGVAKEVYDFAAGRDVDPWDAVATTAGGVLGVCVTAVLRGVL